MIKTIFILMICCLILVFAFAPHVFPFTTDSQIYISTARNITKGNGLVFDNVFVQPPVPDMLPLKLYPPGYSFMIASLHIMGMSAQTAAMVIPRFFFLLLPMGFFLVFQYMMPKKLAMVTAGLCTFLFPYVRCALMAWSDIPYLFLSLISFYFFFKTVYAQGSGRLHSAVFAGVFAGVSLLTRNVGYALVMSAGLGFALMLLMRITTVKNLIKTVASYALGFAAVVAPYMIRNVMVFGKINPYRLPPSNVTLMENLTDYAQSLSQMMLANSHYHLGLLILIMGMLIWFAAFLRTWVNADKQKAFCAIVLIVYFLLGSFLVILAKTLYFGPEKINERYLIQYAWILIAGLSYGIYFLLSKLNAYKSVDTKGITALILIAFLIVQIFPAAEFFFRQKRILNIAQTIEEHTPVLEQIPEDHVIVSNVMDMVSVYSGRNVRLLNGYMPYGLIQLLGVRKKFAVFIIKERSKDHRSYLYPLSWLNPQGYRALYDNRDVVLWLPE